MRKSLNWLNRQCERTREQQRPQEEDPTVSTSTNPDPKRIQGLTAFDAHHSETMQEHHGNTYHNIGHFPERRDMKGARIRAEKNFPLSFWPYCLRHEVWDWCLVFRDCDSLRLQPTSSDSSSSVFFPLKGPMWHPCSRQRHSTT